MMFRRHIALASAAIIVSLTIAPCSAQSPPKTVTIDGSVTPDQIPDSIAYRLFLAAASDQPNSAVDEKARQRAFLLVAGLNSVEIDLAAVILSQFRQESIAINQASLSSADQDSRLGALVTTKMAALAAAVSPTSMARLTIFVQSEKRRMRTFSATVMP